jgi:hypothetical protein
MEYTSILYAEIKLHNPSYEIVTTPLDPNELGPEPTRFTNIDSLNEADMEFHGKFIASGTPPDLTSELYKDHYVTDFKYGIVYGQMITNFIRSKTLSTIVNLIIVMKKEIIRLSQVMEYFSIVK